MAKDFTDQARAAVCELYGEAVYELLAAGRPVTNESLAEAIKELPEEGPDLAEDFALQLLIK